MDPNLRKNLPKNIYNQQGSQNNNQINNHFEEEDDDDDGINVFSDDENDFQKKNTSNINNSSNFKNYNDPEKNSEYFKQNSYQLDAISRKQGKGYLDDEEQGEEGNNDEENANNYFNYGMLNVNSNLNNNASNYVNNVNSINRNNKINTYSDNSINFKNKSDVSSNLNKFNNSQNNDLNINVNLNNTHKIIKKSREVEIGNNTLNLSDVNLAERSGLNISNNVTNPTSEIINNFNEQDMKSKINNNFKENERTNFNPNSSFSRNDISNYNNNYAKNKDDYNSNYNQSRKDLEQNKYANNRENTYLNDEQENDNNDINEQQYNKEYLNTKGTKKSKSYKNEENYENENYQNNKNHNNNNFENNENNDNPENEDPDQEEENEDEREKDEVLEALDINLWKQAEEVFDLFVNEISPRNMDPVAVDLFEMQNLLEVIGIRKNEFEINCAIKKIKGEKLKSFKYEENYTKENFIDVVESFLEFRIEDKLLVEVFRKIDLEENGILNLVKLQEVSKKYQLDFSNEELVEILEFFNMEKYWENKNAGQAFQNFKSTFDFEQFCKLYYQGG